jgi:O-antigen/teichoic acid export membrane protein
MDDGSPSLKEAALSGVRWMAIGKLLTELGALVGSVVLARLIAPGEFGAVAPGAFLLAVGAGLAAASFGTPLVRTPELTPALVRTAFALSLLTGFALTALVLVATECYDFGYSAHELHLLQVVAPTLAIYSVGAVSQALLERDLDFRRSAINDVSGLLPGTLATLILAALGLDGMAIALGYLVTAAFTSVQAIWWRWPGLPWLDRASIRHLVAFGLPTSISGMLYNAQRTIGFGLLGARLGTVSAGYFWRASQLGIEYQSKITNILVRILFPLLSRASTPGELRAVRGRMIKTHTAFLFPLLALLIVLAPQLVPFVYGEQWAGAVLPTQILAVVGFATVVNTGTGPVLMAVGRPGALLIKDAIELPLLIATLVLTASHGLIAACVGMAAFRVVSLLANQYFLVQRLCGIPLTDTLLHDVLPAAAGSAIAAGAAAVATAQLGRLGVPVVVNLALTSLVGLGAYGLALKALFTTTWADCSAVLLRVTPGRRRGRPAALAVS